MISRLMFCDLKAMLILRIQNQLRGILMNNSSERGILQIVMPSGLLHLPTQAPFSYFVLVDGEEIEYEKLSPIILKISFDVGTEELEILGTFWP